MSEKYTVLDDSKYRVAFDLMTQIYSAEVSASKNRPGGDTLSRDRKYFLTLFEQCRKVVVMGKDANAVLGANDDPSRQSPG